MRLVNLHTPTSCRGLPELPGLAARQPCAQRRNLQLHHEGETISIMYNNVQRTEQRSTVDSKRRLTDFKMLVS